MWCRQCQQDVPAVSSGEGGPLVCCARCGERLLVDSHLVSRSSDGSSPTVAESSETELEGSGAVEPVPQTEADARADSASSISEPEEEFPEFVHLDDWGLQEDLRRIERIVQRLRRPAPTVTRVDTATDEHQPAWHVRERVRASGSPAASLGWAAVSLGMMAFVFGGVLIGLAIWNERPELWRIGLPVAFVGQAMLLLGVLLRLDGLKQTRQTPIDSIPMDRERITGVAHSRPHPAGDVRGPRELRRPIDPAEVVPGQG